MATLPPVVPILHFNDPQKNYDYFVDVLGFRPVMTRMGPDGKVAVAQLVWGRGARAGVLVLSSTDDSHEAGLYDHGEYGVAMRTHPLGTGVVVGFMVGDVDKYHDRIRSRGAMIDEPPTDQHWGLRTISVLTPDGYYLSFAAPIKGWKPGPDPHAHADGPVIVAKARKTRRKTARGKRR